METYYRTVKNERESHKESVEIKFKEDILYPIKYSLPLSPLP